MPSEPANVEVAVVEVAEMKATLGEVVPSTKNAWSVPEDVMVSFE